MIEEAKQLLHTIITANVPEISQIVFNSHAEQELINARAYQNGPIVSIITNQGTFDDRANKWDKRLNTRTNTYETRYRRGIRRIPLTLRVLSTDEHTADTVIGKILAHIPRRARPLARYIYQPHLAQLSQPRTHRIAHTRLTLPKPCSLQL